MKLLGTPGSPYVRKVRIMLAEKRLPYDFQVVRFGDPNWPVPAVNPLGKIPALVRDNGRPLYDSAVIAEYIDALSPEPKLIPAAFEDRAEVRRWEALANGVMDSTVAISHDYVIPETDGDSLEASNAHQQKKIDLGLAAMERDLGGRAFCHGGAYTLADIAAGTALLYLDVILPKLDWRARHPRLAALAARLKQRESFQSTRHPLAKD
jgi:glutathione S-transferase